MATSKKAAKTDDPQPGLRIIQLTAANVKRLVAVDIKTDGKGGLVIIGGDNGAGKSSVIDSIAYALAGKKASKDAPKLLRDGTDEGHVRLDFGDLVVTRTWKSTGTDTLEVLTRDGHKLADKQPTLDTLIGPLSLDPLAFLAMKAGDQLATLLGLIELPFSLPELNAERDRTYTERTDINRQLKSAKAIVENLDAELKGVATDAPDLEVALAARQEAEMAVRAGAAAAKDVITAREHMESIDAQLADAEQAITGALHKRDRINAERATREIRLAELESAARAAKAALDEVHMDDLRNDVDRAREAQAVVGKVAERDRLREQAETWARESETLTAAIDAIDKRKADGLAAAAMPVPGLGFDDNGVTFNGLPLSQASGAEGLRVSVAIAMAKNPTAKILLSKEGSLLDAANLAVLREACEGRGVQLWLEVVNMPEGQQPSIIIEAGQVKE